MPTVSLPDRWILDPYMRMLRKVLKAARAHARYSHPSVIDRLSRCLQLEVPDSLSADAATIETYLRAIGQVVVETRYACNDYFDADERPNKLLTSDEPGGAKLLSPGCEAAMSLLDAVDDNFTHMLLSWGRDFWCRPRDLYYRLRQHEVEYESGLARFTGFLEPVEIVAPTKWACDY